MYGLGYYCAGSGIRLELLGILFRLWLDDAVVRPYERDDEGDVYVDAVVVACRETGSRRTTAPWRGNMAR